MQANLRGVGEMLRTEHGAIARVAEVTTQLLRDQPKERQSPVP
jgi:hypothetical protein